MYCYLGEDYFLVTEIFKVLDIYFTLHNPESLIAKAHSLLLQNAPAMHYLFSQLHIEEAMAYIQGNSLCEFAS